MNCKTTTGPAAVSLVSVDEIGRIGISTEKPPCSGEKVDQFLPPHSQSSGSKHNPMQSKPANPETLTSKARRVRMPPLGIRVSLPNSRIWYSAARYPMKGMSMAAIANRMEGQQRGQELK
jgi:hypothetical protein